MTTQQPITTTVLEAGVVQGTRARMVAPRQGIQIDEELRDNTEDGRQWQRYRDTMSAQTGNQITEHTDKHTDRKKESQKTSISLKGKNGVCYDSRKLGR